MKSFCIVLSLFISSTACLAQGIYFAPAPTDVTSAPVRIYVDITSDDCGCPELQDADPDTNPLYFWGWNPNEARPDVTVDGETLNVLNGEWMSSNENLQMSRDVNNPNLWYFDFVGTSLVDFYDVPASELIDNGIDFLIKENNGGPSGLPEQKSQDLNAQIILQGTQDFSIDFETILSGVSSPTTITNAGDERIFVTEQAGRVRVFFRDGTLEPEPFMDIESRVVSGGERGLLGLAFEPNFCESGRFYINYTADDGGLVTRVSRFTIDEGNPMIGDPDSEEILIQFDQDFNNHNGGHIEFGPDGFLYIGTGDGGSGGDPNNRAQDITSYLGKMLRIDVSPETGYDIPLDNPFIFDDFGQDEIWSYGLRNPWKFAFDRQFGNLYIADVGQNAWEEVNFESSIADGGRNYGWRCYEGDNNFNLSGCSAPEYVFPILDYAHSGFGCTGSVTGGRVYRGPSFEAFDGWFFYTDLCNGNYWAVTQQGESTFEQSFGTIGQGSVTTFGEDVWGEVYFANGNGIHRLLDPNDELLEPILQTGSVLSSLLEGVSYEWFFEGNLVGGSSELEITEIGEYTLILMTEDNTCQIESTIDVTSMSTGDYSVTKNPLSVFPNPAQESVMIDMESYRADAHTLAVYSIDGRMIQAVRINSNRLELNVSEYARGAYILNLLDNSGKSIAQSKLIKE